MKIGKIMYKIIKILIVLLFLITLILAGLFVYARFIEPHTLTEKSIEISSEFVSEPANNLKIAVFSDTHFSDNYDLDDFQKVINSIKKNKPDLIFFTGDLFDNLDLYKGNTDDISNALNSIDAPLGKYSIFGNHDYGGGAETEYEKILNAGGFKVLRNQYFGLDSYKISIIGIDDFMLGYGNLEKATWARNDYFNILLCHEPDIIDSVLEDNIDLMVSGHTHGGQVHIPCYTDNILPPYGKNYIYGLYEFNNFRLSKLYVNPGLGTTQINLRFLSPPEITYIIITSTY
jgi:predicted MPP superfamily phosphohydrolase